ncbi:hypothetical protein D3C81_2068560 [compost metagenome]
MHIRATATTSALIKRITAIIIPSEMALSILNSGKVTVGPLASKPAEAYAVSKAPSPDSSFSRNSIRYSMLPWFWMAA